MTNIIQKFFEQFDHPTYMGSTNCPVCNNQNTKKHYSIGVFGDKYVGLQCGRCGWIQGDNVGIRRENLLDEITQTYRATYHCSNCRKNGVEIHREVRIPKGETIEEFFRLFVDKRCCSECGTNNWEFGGFPEDD